MIEEFLPKVKRNPGFLPFFYKSANYRKPPQNSLVFFCQNRKRTVSLFIWNPFYG